MLCDFQTTTWPQDAPILMPRWMSLRRLTRQARILQRRADEGLDPPGRFYVAWDPTVAAWAIRIEYITDRRHPRFAWDGVVLTQRTLPGPRNDLMSVCAERLQVIHHLLAAEKCRIVTLPWRKARRLRASRTPD